MAKANDPIVPYIEDGTIVGISLRLKAVKIR